MKNMSLKAEPVGFSAVPFIETKLFWTNSKKKLRDAEMEEGNYVYDVSGTIGI